MANDTRDTLLAMGFIVAAAVGGSVFGYQKGFNEARAEYEPKKIIAVQNQHTQFMPEYLNVVAGPSSDNEAIMTLFYKQADGSYTRAVPTTPTSKPLFKQESSIEDALKKSQ